MKVLVILALIVAISGAPYHDNQIDREDLAASIYERAQGRSIGEQYNQVDEPQRGWKTWNSIKNAFSPVSDWFRNELPKKTPEKLYNNVKDKVKEYVLESKPYQFAQEHVFDPLKNVTASSIHEKVNDYVFDSKPYHLARDYIIDPVKNFADKTVQKFKGRQFSDIYSDAKDSVSDADNYLGGWINNKVDTYN